MGLVLVWWGLAFRDGLHAAALVAAAGLLASHLPRVLAAYGPDRMAVDPGDGAAAGSAAARSSS